MADQKYPLWGQVLNTGLNLISPAYRNSTNPTGSWGTKEFGVTEGLANTLSGGKTTDLSNAIDQIPGNLVRQVQQNPGQTLGANTVNNPQTTGGNTGNEIFNTQSENAKDQSALDLEAALKEHDYYAQLGQGQITSLGEQQANALGALGQNYGLAQGQATTAGAEATSDTQSAKNKTLSTAQGVQKSNRNVLRALGILSSSAAGEMLNKPMNEYAKQAADLEQGLIQRKNVIKDWLLARSAEFQQATAQTTQKFNDMVNQINTDLRFNAGQRADAVKQASAALKTTLANIEAQKVNYQQTANQYASNILAQIAQLKIQQGEKVDTNALQQGMLSTAIGSNNQSNNNDISVLPYNKKKTV